MQEPSPHWNSSGRHVSRAEGRGGGVEGEQKVTMGNTHSAFKKCTVSGSNSINNTLACAASLACSNLTPIVHSHTHTH